MPTTSDLADRASHILVREQVPFEAIPMQWLTTLDIFKVFMIAIAAYVYRKQNARLSSVISISLILGIVATVIFAFLDDDVLFLLFPWRVSGVLAPIALILIVSAVLNVCFKWTKRVYNHQRLLFLCIVISWLSAIYEDLLRLSWFYPGILDRGYF
jgi:hypothetical protein